MIRIPNEGWLQWLLYLRTEVIGANLCSARLFINDHEFTAEDVLADYDPATFPGSSDLIASPWTVPVIAAAHALTECIPLQWVCGGEVAPESVYGIVYYDNVANVILWVDKFASGPVVFEHVGDQMTVHPTFTVTTEAE